MSVLSCDPAEVQAALTYIDASERDTWLKVGMGIKAELGSWGFELWDAWSQSDAAGYKPKDAKSVWKSFKDSGRVGIGTVFYLAGLNGWKRDSQPHQLTAEEIAARAARREAAELAVIAEQEATAARAATIWAGLPDHGNAAYLDKKRVRAFGLRFSRGAVVVPVVDFGGKLWGLQFIQSDGSKVFLSSMKKQGNFHRIKGGAVLAIAEGYATAATIHLATGWTVLVAFDSSNLEPVATGARTKWPDREMIICGDDDVETKGNPGRSHAIKAAGLVRARVVFPDFLGDEQ